MAARAPLGGPRKGLNKNLENNPMQSRVDPARNNTGMLHKYSSTTENGFLCPATSGPATGMIA